MMETIATRTTTTTTRVDKDRNGTVKTPNERRQCSLIETNRKKRQHSD